MSVIIQHIPTRNCIFVVKMFLELLVCIFIEKNLKTNGRKGIQCRSSSFCKTCCPDATTMLWSISEGYETSCILAWLCSNRVKFFGNNTSLNQKTVVTSPVCLFCFLLRFTRTVIKRPSSPAHPLGPPPAELNRLGGRVPNPCKCRSLPPVDSMTLVLDPFRGGFNTSLCTRAWTVFLCFQCTNRSFCGQTVDVYLWN